MAETSLEQALRDLPRIGKLVKDRSYRQVWRFEFESKPYYLKFYPRPGLRNWIRRITRGSPALREFQKLQWLQKARVPSPRAVAALVGFTINGIKGDAVVLEGLEPSIQLDKLLNQYELAGQDAPNHLELTRQIIDLLSHLAGAGMGHSDLHLGNLLVKDGKVHLLDAYAVQRGGLRVNHVQLLALSARPYATRTDLLRIWRALAAGSPLPATNPRGRSVWNNLLERSFKKDRYFGHLEHKGWSGHYFKLAKFAHRWSPASRLDISDKEWRDAWPEILVKIESDQFEVLKRSPSGDVLAAELFFGGRPLPVIIKRNFRKHGYRYLMDIFRGSRAHRAWTKAWKLVFRNIPTAWPLLLAEKRKLGYVTDAITIFERVPGKPLADPGWAARGAEEYHRLLCRCGRTLRRLEQSGLHLYDAKASNWMIHDDAELGPVPILIDMDGIRHFRQRGGLPRLSRSLRENKSAPYTRAEAASLLRGYEPFASEKSLERLLKINGCGRFDPPPRPAPQASTGT